MVFALLRFTQPYIRRLDLALSLLAEIADIIVFTLAIILLTSTGEEQSVRRNIGISMIVLEAGALALLFIEKASVMWEHLSSLWAMFRFYVLEKEDKTIGGTDGEQPKAASINDYKELDVVIENDK